jgi:hypothetical protein
VERDDEKLGGDSGGADGSLYFEEALLLEKTADIMED